MFTLGTASKAVGVSRNAISKAIANGSLSATHGDKGQCQVQPAELFRVYPAASKPDNQNGRDKTPDEQNSVTLVLEAKIASLQVQLELMTETLADLKAQRDGWQKQAEST
jgi:hypothetical protein